MRPNANSGADGSGPATARPLHDIHRLIPEWFNQHRRSVVWFSESHGVFIRWDGSQPTEVIR